VDVIVWSRTLMSYLIDPRMSSTDHAMLIQYITPNTTSLYTSSFPLAIVSHSLSDPEVSSSDEESMTMGCSASVSNSCGIL
jgi:hypothetical protein